MSFPAQTNFRVEKSLQLLHANLCNHSNLLTTKFPGCRCTCLEKKMRYYVGLKRSKDLLKAGPTTSWKSFVPNEVASFYLKTPKFYEEESVEHQLTTMNITINYIVMNITRSFMRSNIGWRGKLSITWGSALLKPWGWQWYVTN